MFVLIDFLGNCYSFINDESRLLGQKNPADKYLTSTYSAKVYY